MIVQNPFHKIERLALYNRPLDESIQCGYKYLLPNFEAENNPSAWTTTDEVSNLQNFRIAKSTWLHSWNTSSELLN